MDSLSSRWFNKELAGSDGVVEIRLLVLEVVAVGERERFVDVAVAVRPVDVAGCSDVMSVVIGTFDRQVEHGQVRKLNGSLPLYGVLNSACAIG